MTYAEALIEIKGLQDKKDNYSSKAKSLITEEVFESLAILGFIKEGVALDSNEEHSVEVFKLTKSGEQEILYFQSEPSEMDKILGSFLDKYSNLQAASII